MHPHVKIAGNLIGVHWSVPLCSFSFILKISFKNILACIYELRKQEGPPHIVVIDGSSYFDVDLIWLN